MEQSERINECIRTIFANSGGKFSDLSKNHNFNCIDEIIIENKKCEIKSNAHSVKFTAIELTFESPNDIEIFLQTIRENNIYIKIYTDNNVFNNLNFNLLVELNKPYINLLNNSITIDIPSVNFHYDLLERYTLDFSFDIDDMIVRLTKSKLYVNYFVYEAELLNKQFANNPQMYFQEINDKEIDEIDEIYFQEINGGKLDFDKNFNLTPESNNNYTYEFRLNTDNYTKGFFILSDSIDKMNCFELKIYGNNIIKYDKYYLNKYCKKYSDKLLYIPINTNICDPFDKNILETYNGSIDFERIDFKDIIISFESQPNNLSMYLYSLNRICYFNNKTKQTKQSYLYINQKIDDTPDYADKSMIAFVNQKIILKKHKKLVYSYGHEFSYY